MTLVDVDDTWTEHNAKSAKTWFCIEEVLVGGNWLVIFAERFDRKACVYFPGVFKGEGVEF